MITDPKDIDLAHLAPLCAVCGHRVERIQWQTIVDGSGIEVSVYCHGEKESCVLGYDLFLDGIVALEVRPAFEEKRLTDEGKNDMEVP